MSDMNMYNIIGMFKNLIKSDAPVESTAKAAPIYESVEPRGSITEAVRSLEEKYMGFKAVEKAVAKGGAENPAAVAAAIGRKKYGKKKFQKAAAAGKKLGEAAKPDFLDVDKDGDKAEPFKKAVKDKKAVEESGGPYTLDDPKHPKFKATHDKWMAKNPGKKLSDFIAAMRKKEAALGEGKYDEPAAPDAEAIAKRKRLQAIKDRQEAGDDSYSSATKSNVRTVKGTQYGGANQPDEPSPGAKKDTYDIKSRHRLVDLGDAPDDVDEAVRIQGSADYNGKMAAPKNQRERDEFAARAKSERARNRNDLPGAANRQGIKSVQNPDKPWGTKQDLKATMEAIAFGDTVKNSTPKFAKAKMAKLKEARVSEGSEYTYEQVAKALAEEQPGLDTAGAQFREAVYNEIIAQGMSAKTARYLMTADEDFLGDVATSYGYFCKHQDEVAMESAPMEAHMGNAMQELDEIARLAGLPAKTDNIPWPKEVPIDADREREHYRDEEENDPHTYNDSMVDESSDEAKLDHYHELIKQGMDPDDAEVEAFNNDDDEDELDEAEMAEGNEFSGALAAAKANGAKEFEVDGKKYTVKEDINVNITANGQEDALNLFRKLSGMPVPTPEVPTGARPIGITQAGLDALMGEPEVEVAEERDIEYTNTPREQTAGLDAAIPSGNDLNRAKKQYKREYPGDNPMAVKEAALWKSYERMIDAVKK